MQEDVGLAVGHVSVASVAVVSGGVDAAVVGAPFVEKVGVGIHQVHSSLSRGAPVEPALVAVAAGCVTGQSVAAGVAGVLSLTLRGTRGCQTDGLGQRGRVGLR